MVSSSVWLEKESPQKADLWYHNLNDINNKENILTIRVNAIEKAARGQCLTISKTPERSTPNVHQTWFTLESEDCNKPRLTICKLDEDKDIFNHPPLPSRFPCIPKTNSRRKREIRQNRNFQGICSYYY